ncbi:hypothetical protein [Levilactobacillus brevis]|uniref:hypothetical protein n=1 Tax=Levilactobacillus brevis TaxID=1580 RepID=UPI001BDDE826|nr:hypothetical protein [Levilactobacillus brevis]
MMAIKVKEVEERNFKHPNMHPIYSYKKFRQKTQVSINERTQQLINDEVETDQGKEHLRIMLKVIGWLIVGVAVLTLLRMV